MTALRKIIDSDTLASIVDLPPNFMNKKVEVIMFPADDTSALKNKSHPTFSMKQIEEWSKAPEIQVLMGALKGSSLPADISIKDIRNMRLEEKYTT